MTTLKLMAVFAHPDDESLGLGATLAKYAAEGVETYLVCATRGQRGWFGPEETNPGLEALGRIREKELQAAADVLGLREVTLLNYMDGDLGQAPHAEAVAHIVSHLRRVKPQVVVTFGPDGAYGHPDHIAICQFTSAALICAADASYANAAQPPPHRVSKFYYMVDSKDTVEFIKTTFHEEFAIPVDGQMRHQVGWDEWAVTTRIDASEHWRTVLRAIQCHQTQVTAYGLERFSDSSHERLWGHNTLYRVFSLVNGGRRVEQDVFEGLR